MKNPLSLEAFADWAEKQPPNVKFDYCSGRGCAYYQFLTAVGLPVTVVGPNRWFDTNWKEHALQFDPSLVHGSFDSTSDYNWTFGALAKRLRAACA